jgi:hypothetical protein
MRLGNKEFQLRNHCHAIGGAAESGGQWLYFNQSRPQAMKAEEDCTPDGRGPKIAEADANGGGGERSQASARNIPRPKSKPPAELVFSLDNLLL